MTSILVIEDEADIRDMVSRLLTSNGFEVFKASSGEEGLIKAVELNPNLVILDLMMQDISGLEVCRLLKSRQVGKDTPVIILSALGREVDRKYAEKAGADRYLTKPFENKELLLLVDEMLAKSG